MKHILAVVLIFAIVATANGFYVLGGSVSFFVAVALFLILKRGEKILNMYFAMPTVWQNIQETLEIGLKFGVIDDVITLYRIWTFYGILEANEGLFEIKVNEYLVNSFELKYGKLPRLKDLPSRNRALLYFVDAARLYPERLLEILQAVQVRKKAGGKKQDPEKEVSMVLTPIYLT